MRILVCYATTEGQTRKVAEKVADLARRDDHEIELREVTTAGDIDPGAYDAALIAGSVHMGRYQAALTHQIKLWHDRLNAMPAAFISVSLSAASHDPHAHAEIDECAQAMLREAGWTPNAMLHAAGALRFTAYDFFRLWIARMLAAQFKSDVDPLEDREYTDWEAVRDFVETFIASARDPSKAAV